MADIEPLLRLGDQIYENQCKLIQSGVVSDKMCLLLVNENERLYETILKLKQEQTDEALEWHREKSILTQEFEHMRALYENEKKLRLNMEQRVFQLDQMVEFIRVILTEEGANGDEPPKVLSEKTVQQLWRMRSFRASGQQNVSLRQSEASCPESEDLEKDTDYNTVFTRPRSPSYGLAGGHCLPSSTTPTDSEQDDKKRRALHWGPGSVMNTHTSTVIGTDYESDSSGQSSRKRASEDSSDSYFGIKVRKIRDECAAAAAACANNSALLTCVKEETLETIVKPTRLTRQHEFQVKTASAFVTCFGCGKRLPFGKSGLKCSQCKVLVHAECKHLLAAPCLLSGSKSAAASPLRPSISHEALPNTQKGNSPFTPQSGKSLHAMTLSPGPSPSSPCAKRYALEDLVPLHEDPKVPSILIQCISEIERRGLREAGIYRVCGSDRQIKELFTKMMRGKMNVGLSTVDDVHCIAGCLKLFLKSLSEPLVSYAQWHSLARIAETYFSQPKENSRSSKEMSVRPSCVNRMGEDGKYYLSYECLEEFMNVCEIMRKANRDTLSYLMLHLKRVSNSAPCNMNVDNLCKVLGPTVVGHSAANTPAVKAMKENAIQLLVMRLFISVPDRLYTSYLNNTAQINIPTAVDVWEKEHDMEEHTDSLKGRPRRRFFASLYPQND